MFVDYNESILSYVSSIRKYFGLESSFVSNSSFDELLDDNKPKRIFTILVDGMGYNLITKKLPEDSFLRKNIAYKTTTVYPPTTTAATTAVRNGKAPNENAWLGWCQYFKEIDDVVIPFYNKAFYSDNSYPNFALNAIPVTTTTKELNEKGYKTRILFPSFLEDGCESFVEMCERLAGFSKNKEFDYIYAYWDLYDSLMHKYGPSSKWCDIYLNHVNECLEHLAEEIDDDTLLMVIADHGQIDISEYINLYPEYHDYLVHAPSLEPRTMAFHVKEGMKDEFEMKFKNDFEDKFILLTHEQVLQSKLFGPNENNPRFEEFIGDFIALAKGKACLSYQTEEKPNHKGQHAGTLEDELMIPVIIYQK